MVERNARRSTRAPHGVTVGIHLGDVVEESDGDLMGDGVNIASAWRGSPSPAQSALSEQAYWQVKGRLDLPVTDLGPTQLKNIADPIRVLFARACARRDESDARLRARKSAPPRLSIVVLPFANAENRP